MSKKPSPGALIIFLILLSACSRQDALLNPYSYAPSNASSSWAPLKRSMTITSKYCAPLFPKEYKESDSLTLAELIDISLMNNPQTKQTWANARAAAANYGQTLSAYLPEINLNGQYTRERDSTILEINETQAADPNLPQKQKLAYYYSTTAGPEVNLSYLIYDFGKRKSTTESAKQTLYYADWMHNWEIQDVMQSVMSSYYNYQYQLQAQTALEADLENASASLDAATSKFTSGTAAIGDVVQAKTSYLQTKMNLFAQKTEVDKALATLLNNLGLPSNDKIKIENLPENAQLDFVLENLDILVLKAENLRPDFLAVQATVKYEQAQLNYAKSAGLPDITSHFDIGRFYFNSGFHENYHFLADVRLSMPIFKGLYYRNGIKSAEAKLLNAQAQLQQRELDITKEVTISRSTVASAAQILTCSKDYLAEAKKRFDIALSSYKAGTMTILDVISAQSSLADARARNAKSKRDWFSSIADLAYYTGALCTPENNISRVKCYEN